MDVWLTVVVPIGNFPDNRDNILEYVRQLGGMKVELILVMDGQKKNDVEDLVLYSKPYSKNVSVLECDAMSAGGARNCGLDKVKTEWVLFWDCDDRPNFSQLKNLLSVEEPEDTSAILASFSSDRHLSKVNKKLGTVLDSEMSRELINPGIWRWVFRTRAIKDVIRFPELSMGEDQIFLAHFLALEPKIDRVDKNIYFYVIHERSDQSGSFKYQNQVSNALLEVIPILESHDLKFRFSISVIAWNLFFSSIKFEFISRRYSDIWRSIFSIFPVSTKLVRFLPRYLKLRFLRECLT